MIPAAFDYKRAESADEAIALITEPGDEAKFLAGGHSLLPLMRLRLAQPTVLVDIGRLRDLSYIRDAGDHIAIGALTRHRDIETSDLLKAQVPLLATAASYVGDPQVRHRGTIGGSIAHSDPASDLPATVLALGGTHGRQGRERRAGHRRGGLLHRLPRVGVGTRRAVHRDPGAEGRRRRAGRSRSSTGGPRTGPSSASPPSTTAPRASPSSTWGRRRSSPRPWSTPSPAAPRQPRPPSTRPTMPNRQADLNASIEYRTHLAKVLVRRALEEAGA